MYVQSEDMSKILKYKDMIIHAHTSNPAPAEELNRKRIFPTENDSFRQEDFIAPLKAIGVETCSIEAEVIDFEKDVRDAYKVLAALRWEYEA